LEDNFGEVVVVSMWFLLLWMNQAWDRLAALARRFREKARLSRFRSDFSKNGEACAAPA
jgi:hypothetical protein